MAINRNYEFKDENKLLYSIDNYTVNSGLAIDFQNDNATLRNINVNKKSNNFFGNGELGSQTYIGEKALEPTTMYFRNLILNDPTYGTHLEGVFAETGQFNIGDELILYKKHCSDKALYNEVGKWDLVNVIDVVEDGEGKMRYVLDRVPDNEYDDLTANTATVTLQYENLTVGATTFLTRHGLSYATLIAANGSNAGMGVAHPEKGEPWRGRTLTNPVGILCIKVKDRLQMLKGGRIANPMGYWGGAIYSNRAGWQLDTTEVRHDYHIPPCGFLPSPSDMMSTNSGPLSASDLCDFTGYNATGGASFWNDGDRHVQEIYASRQIPSKYYEASDVDKMYFGIAGAPTSYDYKWAYGSDGGGITIIQAKETILEEDAYINTAPTQRYGTYDSRWCGVGAGGHTILKSPNIIVNTERPFIGSVASGVDSDWSTWAINLPASGAAQGIPNPGHCTLEFESMTIGGTEYEFTEVISGFDTLKDNIFKDSQLIGNMLEDSLTATKLARQQDYKVPSTEELKVLAPTTSMSEYETGKFYKAFTAGMHNVDTELWNTVSGFNIDATIPDDTDMRFLLSRDGGSTWFKINTATDNLSAVGLTDIADGNTLAELNEYNNVLALTSQLVANNDAKTLDLAVGMKTTKSYKSPSINYVEFLYEGVNIPDAPIRILPYHEEEFDRENVDFVWMQPLQVAGNLQNRLEISPTSNFEPQEETINIATTNTYSQSGNKIHIPFSARQVDNFKNDMTDLVLPYMLVKGEVPKSTYDEYKTSGEYDDTLRQINYTNPDTFFVLGNSKTLPTSTMTVPDINIAAPLMSETTHSSRKIAVKISDRGNQSEIADSHGVLNLEKKNIYYNDSSYIGDVAYFDGSAEIKDFVLAADKVNHPLWENGTEKTIHIKFNIKSFPSAYSYMFAVRRSVNSTAMMELIIYPNYIKYNGVSSYHTTGYLGQKGMLTEVEQNITITSDSNNNAKVYLNGRLVINGAVYNKYPDYVEADNTYDIGLCIGKSYPDYNSYTFNGNMHEFVMYDTMMTEDEVMAMSKLPNYHYRYDVEDAQYKLLQLPYNDVDFIGESEVFNNYSLGVDGVVNNDFTPTMLSNFENPGYKSNNKSILVGKYYPKPLERNNYTNVISDKHIIMGYNYYTNWAGVTDRGQLTINSSNTIENNYSTDALVLARVGRINKQNTNTELEFYCSSENVTATSPNSHIGITYGLYSVSNTHRYYAYIRRIGSVFSLQVYIYSSSYNIPLPEFEWDHRYVLSLTPTNGSFSTNFDIRLYSKTNTNYEDNPILFSSSEYYGYITNNRGFLTKDYSDRVENSTAGDWVDAGAFLSSHNSQEFKLIGMTCFDDVSTETRASGYTDNYFVEKRLAAGLTYNIIRMNVTSEINSALIYVKHIISFDNGVTWKMYDSGTKSWVLLADEEAATVKVNGMTDADLFAVTDSVALTGGFGQEHDTLLRTYLITDDNAQTPYIRAHSIKKNGPRIIDSWEEAGSYYRSQYDWSYSDDNSWNPYLEIDTSGASGQNWEDFGTGIPNPTTFVDGNGSKPSTNLAKVYGTVKVDCLPKGKWYWRVAAYNGLKK